MAKASLRTMTTCITNSLSWCPLFPEPTNVHIVVIIISDFNMHKYIMIPFHWHRSFTHISIFRIAEYILGTDNSGKNSSKAYYMRWHLCPFTFLVAKIKDFLLYCLLAWLWWAIYACMQINRYANIEHEWRIASRIIQAYIRNGLHWKRIS